MTATLLDRPAAVAMACAAVGIGDATGLRDVLGAIGAIEPPPRPGPPRRPGSRRGRSLRPWGTPEPPAPTVTGPYGPCLLPGCDDWAAAPGAPCDECWDALEGFTRPLEVAR